ncbi:MAG: hypothetical protein ACREM3_21125 [Candidatus Rokuibacteriota bacterium]
MNTFQEASQPGEGQALDVQPQSPVAAEAPQSGGAQEKGHGRVRRAAGAGQVKTCGAPTAGGGPCPVRPLTGHPSGKCRQHAAAEDPTLAAQVALERSQGGKTGRMALALRQLGLELEPTFSTPEGVVQAMEQVAGAVARGAITSSAAGAISQLAGVALRAMEAKATAQVDELIREAERRLQELPAHRGPRVRPVSRLQDRLRVLAERLAELNERMKPPPRSLLVIDHPAPPGKDEPEVRA